MKRFLSLSLAALLALSLTTGCVLAEAGGGSNGVRFDFEKDDGGFVPLFADYPDDEGAEEFYELRHGHDKVPISGAGRGLFLSGNNHSDDLFMGYVKALEGFVPGRTYRFTLSFRLATDVEGDMFGIGGAPGGSVSVKCGITSTEPRSTGGPGEYFRLNIDAGVQANDGEDMIVVGDMAKRENTRSGEYEFNGYQAEFETAANILGEVWLIVGTDSGFEGTSSWYLDDVEVRWEDTEQPAAARALAAQMLFDTADRAAADPRECSFRDVAVDAPCAEAIAWAEKNGYLLGYGDGRFGPEDSMTVEQAMVMLHRFFGTPDIGTAALNGVRGGDLVSPWAGDAVAWALENGFLPPAESISPRSPITVEELTYAIRQIVVAC